MAPGAAAPDNRRMDGTPDLATAPFRDARYAPRRLDIERRDDGSLVLATPTPFATTYLTTLDALDRWNVEAPERVWLAERDGEGWRTVTYAQAARQVSALAGGLQALGLKRGDCLLILARNGVDHALISYATMSLGAAVAPVSPQYGLAGADLSRLAYASNAGTMHGMSLTQAAVNAQATGNNVPITSESNSVSNALPGITLTLNKLTTAPVEVGVQQGVDVGLGGNVAVEGAAVDVGQDVVERAAVAQGFVDGAVEAVEVA